jgi:hypothetical protein
VSEAAWNPVGYVSDDMVETAYQLCLETAGGNTQIILALELERKGGKCPICGREYQRVDVDSEYGHFIYYQPGCLCFRRCKICDRFMVAERFLNIWYCTYCHPDGIEEKHKARRRHKPAYQSGGKDAAAGGENNED